MTKKDGHGRVCCPAVGFGFSMRNKENEKQRKRTTIYFFSLLLQPLILLPPIPDALFSLFSPLTSPLLSLPHTKATASHRTEKPPPYLTATNKSSHPPPYLTISIHSSLSLFLSITSRPRDFLEK